MEPETVDLKTARKTYSTIGLALAVVLLAASLGQLAWFSLPGEESWMVSSSWGYWLGSFLPLYLLAIPLGLLILKAVPAEVPQAHNLSGKAFFTLLPICFCVMYTGNLVGTALSMLLSGGTAENAVLDYAMDTNPIKVVFMVILAPLIEEFLCRKMVIDRVRCYGEKTAVFLSALVFGLMHQNLFQFFYAFALGYVFAYIYLRTGQLRYSVILHTIINFMGGVVAPFLLTVIDLEAIENLDPTAPTEELLAIYADILPGLLLYMGYAFLLFGLSVAGFVLILVKRKQMIWQEAPRQLPRGQAAKTAYLNPGMLIYILLCLAAFVLALS